MASAGYEVFRKYLALKLHFTSDSYDYHKYNAKTKADSWDHYLKRRDRFFFEKLGRRHVAEIEPFLVANFAYSDKWIGDMLTEDSEKVYMNWKKNIDALQYNFKNDLKFIQDKCETLENAIDTAGLSHPMLLQFLLGKKVSLETVIIINACRKFIPTWTDAMLNDPIYKKKLLLMKKYRSFLQVDIEVFKKILDDILPISFTND